MKVNKLFWLFFCLLLLKFGNNLYGQKLFDVHLHGEKDVIAQMQHLSNFGVYKAALSTTWELQDRYENSKVKIFKGLMFPCPNGKVPYSLQSCYVNGQDWPDLAWVEQQIKEGKIDFFGELLNQYYGIPANDRLLFPYYALAEQYQLPVGIHTGGAGPGHGAPNFQLELGNPIYIDSVLMQFPGLKIWVMHAGDQYYLETIRLMENYKTVYTDISVIGNPEIYSVDRFAKIMKAFIDAGLEDRMLFGSDNGPIEKLINTIEALDFLSVKQKKKLYYKNAERFFKK